MFGRYRKELENLKNHLEEMAADVPAEAVTFHRHCQSISNAVGELISKWFGTDTKQIERLKLRVEKLDALAGGLIELIRAGQKVAEQVSRLRENAKDSEERAFIIKRCDNWMSIINKLGKDVEHDRHLQLDQKEILKVKNAVHEHVRAVDLLEQAEKYCRTLGPLDTALLKATLPRWKEDFRTSGPNAKMLAELETLLEPLQRTPQPQKTPQQKTPEGIQPLRRIFAELRDWARVQRQEISPALQDSFRRLTQGDTLPSEIQGLQESLGRELQQLRATAGEERTEKLQQIRQDIDHYQRACGVNHDVEERIERLVGNPGDSPQNYEEWMTECQDTEQFLAGIAQARQEILSSYLQSRVGVLEQRRQELVERPLTRVLRTNTVSLGGTIGQLYGATGQMNIRQALRTADSVETKLAALERQAQEDISAYNRKRSTLLDRIAELKSGTAAFDKPPVAAACEDFKRRIDEEVGALNDLDEMNARLADMDAAVHSLAATFLAEATMLLKTLFDYCRNAHRAVSTATEALGKGPREPRLSRSQPLPASPVEAARDLDILEKLQQSYTHRIQSLSEEVELAVKTGRTHLVKLLGEAGYLSPEQRHEGTELVKDIEDPSLLPAAADTLQHFEFLASLLDRYKTFIRLTEGEREELQKFHSALKDRLRKFGEEDFKKMFPEAAERASSLIYGVDPEWLCSDMRKQLELAAGVLHRVETQARRLAADELEKACAAAAVYLRTPQWRWAEQMRNALEEIGEHAPAQLAPASVRRRLLRYVSLPGGVGRV
jgi:hypothetical protein